jgi:hypothetical protein
VFNDILKNLDAKMRSENRHILLLIDNAPVHIVEINLTNIRVEFLLANSTTYLQPCDAGIINSFKCQYKRIFIQHQVEAWEAVEGTIRYSVNL